jgi:hypothetical protein
MEGYMMETLFSVLALIVSIMKIIVMWLKFKECKKAKETQTKTK